MAEAANAVSGAAPIGPIAAACVLAMSQPCLRRGSVFVGVLPRCFPGPSLIGIKSRAGLKNMKYHKPLVARPKRFELLTPRFVVCGINPSKAICKRHSLCETLINTLYQTHILSSLVPRPIMSHHEQSAAAPALASTVLPSAE